MGCVLKKVANFIVNVIMTFVFLILLVVIAIKLNMLVSGKNYFSINGYSIFCVATGSMEPTISQNDIIIVKKSDTYKTDDIITFMKGNEFITHRIVSINDETVTTKGDANNAVDVAVSKDKIIGKVIKIYYNMGVWQKILTTPSIIIMIFVTLLLFDFAFSYKGFNKKKKEKQENVEDKKDIDDISKLSSEDIKLIMDSLDKSVKKEKTEENTKLDYTVRLDLPRIQKEIEDKIKE